MKKHITLFGILTSLALIIFYLTANKPENAVASAVFSTPFSAEKEIVQTPQEKSELPAIIKSPSTAGEVIFPHLQHVEDFEIECQSCHHETNAAELKIPHEEYFDDFWIDCKICHQKGDKGKLLAQSCSECHHTDPANIADETLSSKVVIHKSCWECHEVGTGKEASESCQLCHSGDRSKP